MTRGYFTWSRCYQHATMTVAHPRKQKGRKTCRDGPRAWCVKYFWEGQQLSGVKPTADNLDLLPAHKRLLTKNRRLLGFIIPALTYHFFWLAIMIQWDLWHHYVDKYPMAITMVFGSMIAGLTGIGGGAVAFPVMTLVLNLTPSMARDFSLMIQTNGMIAATFTIFFMGVVVEWHALITCTVAGVGGIIFGLHVIDPVLKPQHKKMGFVSIWFAFAVALLFLNRVRKRKTFKEIPNMNWWRFWVLFLFGFVGGIFTSFAGTGIDICVFMVLTLFFRVSEKVATPTSVIAMALNSAVGFYWRGVMIQGIMSDTWEYLAVATPVVVVGAPVGSVLGSHFHRLVLASLVIALNTVGLVGGFLVVRPMTPALIGVSVAIIIGCFGLFMLLTFAGQKILNREELDEQDPIVTLVPPVVSATQKSGFVNNSFAPGSDIVQDSSATITYL